MKKITKYIFSLAAVLFALTSCDDNVKPHEPGEPEESGCYGVFFPAQTDAYTLDPADPTEVTVKVARTNSNGAIEVPYTFTSKPEGVLTAGTVSFADGQSETTVKVEFPTSEVGVKYTGSFVVSDTKYASKYNTGAVAFDFSVTREKWNDLGWGTWYENGDNGYFVFEYPEDVRFEQNDSDKNLFRIEMINKKGEPVYTDDQDQYFKFKVCKAGEVVKGSKVTETGMVWFDIFNSGYYNSNYPSAPIWFCHPGSFTNYSDPATYWTYNKVLQYQEDGVTPAGINIAPYYYINGVGGWNFSQSDDVITIVFPGAVLTDFSLEVTADFTNAEAKTPLTFTAGKDVTSVKYACFEGELNVAQVTKQAAAIVDGTVEAATIEEFDEEGYAAAEVSFENSGAYTVVAVSYDGEEAKQTASASFNYFNAEDVAANEVKVACDVEDTPARYGEKFTDLNSFAYYVIGEELTDVHVTVVPFAKFQKDADAYLADLKADEDGDYAVDEATLDAINAPGGYYSVVSGLAAETQYVLLVWATNGKLEGFDAAVYETAPNPEVWVPLAGKAIYTDDIVMSMYGESADDCPTYEVEIEESQDHPGKYRLVNPYGEVFPYNEPGDWDDSKNYYFVIDATNPEQVTFPEQYFGIDWGYGEMGAIMMADYLIQTGQATEAELIAAGYYGTLKDGVITFGAKTIGAIEGEDLYYGNVHGLFKVVLPSAAEQETVEEETSVSVNKSAAHTSNAFAKSVNTVNVFNAAEREGGNAVSFKAVKAKVEKAPKAPKTFIAE